MASLNPPLSIPPYPTALEKVVFRKGRGGGERKRRRRKKRNKIKKVRRNKIK